MLYCSVYHIPYLTLLVLKMLIYPSLNSHFPLTTHPIVYLKIFYCLLVTFFWSRTWPSISDFVVDIDTWRQRFRQLRRCFHSRLCKLCFNNQIFHILQTMLKFVNCKFYKLIKYFYMNYWILNKRNYAETWLVSRNLKNTKS